MQLPYSITPQAVSVMVGSRMRVVRSTTPNFNKLVAALRKPQHNQREIEELADLRVFIAKQSFGKVQIANDEVRYDGQPVTNALSERLLWLLANDLDTRPVANFLDRVMLNPSEVARKELFLWLEAGNAPITENGFFRAFKRVRGDYMDVHSGTVHYKIGTTVKMPREKVNPNRDQTCSTGLHFCQFGYLSSFSGSRILILEIDPAHVVAIPSDYSNQKGRAAEVFVVGELESDAAPEKHWEQTPVVQGSLGYDPVGDAQDEEDDEDRENPLDINEPDEIDSSEPPDGKVLTNIEVGTRLVALMDGADMSNEEAFISGDTYDVFDVLGGTSDHDPLRVVLLSDEDEEVTVTPYAHEWRLAEAQPLIMASEMIDNSPRIATVSPADFKPVATPRATSGEELLIKQRTAKAPKPAKVEKSKPVESELTFKTVDGRVFTASVITDGVKRAGSVRAWAREQDLGKSSVQGWLKKIG